MRVISQDGYTDVPYEDFVFGATDDWKIKVAKDVVYNTGQGKLRVIAEYSSREKALKAMEMLRKSWLGESLEFENGFYHKNCVFQFPADDEVKV